MNKKEEFLKLIKKIEPKLDYYAENLNNPFFNKFGRIFILKHKFFIKLFSILLFTFFKIKIIKKIKLPWGRDFYAYLHDTDSSAIYFFGTLYAEELKIIKFLIENLKENDIFYDIGANYGFYSVLAKEFIKTGEIHSFEPLPEVFNLLSRNVGNVLNVKINQIALNNYDGEAQFFSSTDKRHSGASSLVINKNSNLIKVDCLKLDSYCLNHKPPTIAKIDVEGAEFLVLEGGINTLKKYKPVIIMEFFNDEYHLKAVDLLFKLGYKMYSLTKDGELNLVSAEEFDNIIKGVKKPDANYVFKTS